MKSRVYVGACIAAALILGAGSFTGAEDWSGMTKQEWGDRERINADTPNIIDKDPVQVEGPARAIGTIQYDTGVMTGTAGAPYNDYMVGNQFDTFNTGLPVMASGFISTVHMYRADTAGGTLAYLSLYGPVTAGGAAPKLLTTNLPMGTGINTLTGFGPVSYTGSSFLVGMWQAGTSADIVGLDNNLGPMGAHGCAIDDNYPAATGLSFTLIPGVNAIVRATGNIVPVELQNFDVE